MQHEYLEERVIRPQDQATQAINEFLARFGLTRDPAVEYTTALYYQNRIIAAGSLAGANLCGIAVDPDFRGKGLSAKVVGNLINEAGRRGQFRCFVEAAPQVEEQFLSLGFSKIACPESTCTVLAVGFEP